MTIANEIYDPIEATSVEQLRESKWFVPPENTWGVKKKSTAHLFPNGQHFSLCGVRVRHDDSVALDNPSVGHHPACRYCKRIAKPDLGHRKDNEKGDRPNIDRGWARRQRIAPSEPLLSVAQFQSLLDQPKNIGFRITRNKVIGNTLFIFTDTGLMPIEYVGWLTQTARNRDEVEWVEFVKYVDPVNR